MVWISVKICFSGQTSYQRNVESTFNDMPLFGAVAYVGVRTMERLRIKFFLPPVKIVQHKREPQSDSPSAVRKHTPFSTHVLYNILRKNASKNSNLITYLNGYLILYL